MKTRIEFVYAQMDWIWMKQVLIGWLGIYRWQVLTSLSLTGECGWRKWHVVACGKDKGLKAVEHVRTGEPDLVENLRVLKCKKRRIVVWKRK